jgi:hypothetical protein
MLMHTALRKCCDSTATSIAWNAVHLSTRGVWSGFAAACAEAGATTGEELLAVFENPGLPKVDGEMYVWQILDMAFEMFDEGDWDGMAAYLGES